MTLRVLTSLQSADGSHADSYKRALQRIGAVVLNVDPLLRSPESWGGWTSPSLKALARGIRPLLRRDHNLSLLRALEGFHPDLFFTVKGSLVGDDFLIEAKRRAVMTANFFPDVSMTAHGKGLRKSLQHYDWIISSKSYGPEDVAALFGGRVRSAWVPHGFDPQRHRPITVDRQSAATYGSDVVFVGTWSPKKQAFLEPLAARLAGGPYTLRVWGEQWSGKSEVLRPYIAGRGLDADEYPLALSAARVAIGLLSEARSGSSSGDLTTTRTFEIPACRCAMVHEDNAEVRQFFQPDHECLLFSSADGLVAAVTALLENESRRARLAEAGFSRCHESGYSVDARMSEMLSLLGLGAAPTQA